MARYRQIFLGAEKELHFSPTLALSPMGGGIKEGTPLRLPLIFLTREPRQPKQRIYANKMSHGAELKTKNQKLKTKN